MTRDEFLQEAETGEFHTLVYNSASKGPGYAIHVFIKTVDERTVLVMDDTGRFLRLGYDRITDVL